jgi:hypothetical protein
MATSSSALPTLRELLRELRESAALARFSRAIAFVEQPLPRQLTFDVDLHGQDAGFPMLIDEADATLDAFPRARSLGYKGVIEQELQGSLQVARQYAALRRLERRLPHLRLLCLGEDLTTPAGLALQQDLVSRRCSALRMSSATATTTSMGWRARPVRSSERSSSVIRTFTKRRTAPCD